MARDRILNTSDVSITGARIQGESRGVAVEGTEVFLLDRIDFSDNGEEAVSVECNSNGSIERSWIHLAALGEDSQGFGRGIQVQGSSNVSIKDSLIEAVSFAGVSASSPGTLPQHTPDGFLRSTPRAYRTQRTYVEPSFTLVVTPA